MTTPASWQPDPEDPQHSVRYWDGEQWTGHTRPRVPDPDATTVLPAAAPAGDARNRKKWPWIAGAAVVGFVAIGALNNEEAKPAPASVVQTTTRAATTTTTATTTTKATTTTSTAAVTSSSVPVAPLAPATTPVATTTPAYVPPPVVTTPAYVPPPAPAYTPPTASGPAVVNPGSYCSGGTGVTKKGTPMVCAPAKDGEMRWKSAN